MIEIPGDLKSNIGYAFHKDMALHKKIKHNERPESIYLYISGILSIDYHL